MTARAEATVKRYSMTDELRMMLDVRAEMLGRSQSAPSPQNLQRQFLKWVWYCNQGRIGANKKLLWNNKPDKVIAYNQFSRQTFPLDMGHKQPCLLDSSALGATPGCKRSVRRGDLRAISFAA